MTNVLIKSDIKIIEFILAPTQIIIKGPSATLGKLFNIVFNKKYEKGVCPHFVTLI